MKITGIEIDRFGLWRRFNQPLDQSGLTVFYGPNEAGKTTLLRFIRGVLYGFPPEEAGVRRRVTKQPRQGSLTVSHRGQSYHIHRAGVGDEPGLLSINGVDPGIQTARVLGDLLNGVDEQLFEKVFAVGLPELQQFATLNQEQVAKHLYGMTLGPQGRLLMELPDRIDAERRRLIGHDSFEGRLPSLYRRHQELRQQAGKSVKSRERYRELQGQREELEERITRHKQRQTDLQQTLRGSQFLERLWAPWNRVATLRREYDAIPDLRDFPPDGLNRLDRIEHELRHAQQSRELLLREADDLSRRGGEAVREKSLRTCSYSIQSLADQQPVIREAHDRLAEIHHELAETDQRLHECQQALGRIAAVDRLDALPSPETAESAHRLVTAAHRLRQLHTRTRRQQRRYRRRNLLCRDRELALRSELGRMGVDFATLDRPFTETEDRLARLSEFGRGQTHLAELHQRTISIDEQLERLQDHLGLPDWAYVALALFALAGLALVVAGVAESVTTGWIVGLIYICLSCFAGGIMWTIKHDYEHAVQVQVTELREERRKNARQIAEWERRLRQLAQEFGLNWQPPKPHEIRRRYNADVARINAATAVPLSATGTPQLRSRQLVQTLSPSRAPSTIPIGPGKAVAASEMATPSLQPWTEVASQTAGVKTYPVGATTYSSTVAELDRPRGWVHRMADLLQGRKRAAALRPAIQQFDRRVPAPEPQAGEDLLIEAARRLADLEQARREWLQLQRHRRLLSVMRGQLQIRQRDLAHARQVWCQTLADLGCEPTFKIGEAIRQWQRLQQAQAYRLKSLRLRSDQRKLHSLYEQFRRQIEDIGRRMQRTELNYTRPLEVLELWLREMAAARERRREGRELLKLAQSRKKEATLLQKRLDQLHRERTALFGRAGVVDRSQLEHRLTLIERRQVLHGELQQAERDLQLVAQSEPELALMEDDLLRYRPADNAARIKQCQQELAGFEQTLTALFEQLGTVKQEIKSLEADRTGSQTRYALRQTEDELRGELERLFAVTLAADATEDVSIQFEQTHQPDMLAAAIPFLQRLTLGKYLRIWTALSARQLFVDDDSRVAIPAEQLSGGTREQLFLSIRLAMVRSFGLRGIELPMVLDDVTVNFDHERSEATADTLIDFAQNGQQLLIFTSHLHFAEMFQKRGIEPVWLPGRRSGHDDGRLAG